MNARPANLTDAALTTETVDGMTLAQITEAAAIRAFLLGGNARATLRFKLRDGTSKRYTYRVKLSESEQYGNRYFVSFLTGSNNDTDFSTIGNFRVGSFGTDRFYPPRSRPTGRDSLPFRAFDRFAKQIEAGIVPETVEFWHAGRCCRCGRTLTVPESIASGIGPVCATRGS